MQVQEDALRGRRKGHRAKVRLARRLMAFATLFILNFKTFIVYVPPAWCNPKAMNRNASLWICEGKDL